MLWQSQQEQSSYKELTSLHTWERERERERDETDGGRKKNETRKWDTFVWQGHGWACVVLCRIRAETQDWDTQLGLHLVLNSSLTSPQHFLNCLFSQGHGGLEAILQVTLGQWWGTSWTGSTVHRKRTGSRYCSCVTVHLINPVCSLS